MSLDRISIVLVETSHPGNVGAAARAMRVMGLSDLRLVAPRHDDAALRDEARAFASGATDVLSRARVFATLDEALGDVTLAIAVSAAGREFAPSAREPEACAAEALAELRRHPSHRAAFVFGSERVGLSIEQAQRCQLLLSIPAEPDYSSLNLAQAVQVVTYCLRRASLTKVPDQDQVCPSPGQDRSEAPMDMASAAGLLAADQRAIEGFYTHLESALVAIGYLDPKHPKKLMPRLRRLFSRTRLEQEEVDLLRGVCKMMERTAERASRKAP
jgi:tRNA/rRNA methyltransferase